MEFGPYTLLMDFALISILLFIAQFLRAKIKIIQALYLPASLIAGFLALFLGEQFLNIFPFSGKISIYPYMLVVVLFASLFIGSSQKLSIKKVFDEVGDTFSLSLAAEIGGFGIALLLGGFLIKFFFQDVPDTFPILAPGGFIGGHGYAAAIGSALNELSGWKEALTIGQTFATIGILNGIVGGLILINIATRLKATRLVESVSELPESMRTGLVPENERQVMGKETVSPMSIDPLAWHISLVLIASAGGYYLYHFFKIFLPNFTLPMMCLSMLAGVFLQLILNKIGFERYVDKRIINRIGSSVTDYLVAFGIASINISVVIQYAHFIIIMSAICVLWSLFYVLFIGRKLYHNFWFERSIFIYGWTTGVVAMGIILLRIVDPDFRSKTLEDYSIAYVFISLIELLLISILPVYIVSGNVMLAGVVLIIICMILWILTAVKYGIQTKRVSELRQGEAEIIAEYLKKKQFEKQ